MRMIQFLIVLVAFLVAADDVVAKEKEDSASQSKAKVVSVTLETKQDEYWLVIELKHGDEKSVRKISPAHLKQIRLIHNGRKIDPTVGGKYKKRLHKLYAPEDVATYGLYTDWSQGGMKWHGTNWGGHTNLKPGYWVWAFPYWYVWAESTEAD